MGSDSIILSAACGSMQPAVPWCWHCLCGPSGSLFAAGTLCGIDVGAPLPVPLRSEGLSPPLTPHIPSAGGGEGAGAESRSLAAPACYCIHFPTPTMCEMKIGQSWLLTAPEPSVPGGSREGAQGMGARAVPPSATAPLPGPSAHVIQVDLIGCSPWGGCRERQVLSKGDPGMGDLRQGAAHVTHQGSSG